MTQFNFEGWSITSWFTGNWATIKEVAKVGLPLITIWVTTGDYWMTGFGTILGKFILDGLHYFVKE